MQKASLGLLGLLVIGCTTVTSLSQRGTLILKPEITAGQYGTKSVISPYTKSDIQHLVLKIFTYDGAEHDQGIQRTLLNAQLDNPIVFSNLKPNTTYRIKAYAYLDAGESTLISVDASPSYSDIVLTNDDRPSVATLSVKLIDRVFNGQATSSISITNGSYSPVGSESLVIPKVVYTVAGGGGGTIAGFADGAGTVAKFNNPRGIAVDSAGNLYVGDYFNNLVRKILPGGFVTTLAGIQGAGGYLDGIGTGAKFNCPKGVAVDASGNVFVIDVLNCAVRKITSAGVVNTFAGTPGTAGYVDGTGTSAKLNCPFGIAVDAVGNLYIADTENQLIRKVTSGGVVSTLAGGGGATAFGYADGMGTSAKFYHPLCVAVDGAGNVYITDTFNNLVRKITSAGMVSTFAGGGGGTIAGYTDGTGTAALFASPGGIAVDGAGNVYVTDGGNSVIRKITTSGVVSTFAGTPGTAGYVDGTASAARFNSSSGLAYDAFGNLYVADGNNQVIRVIR